MLRVQSVLALLCFSFSFATAQVSLELSETDNFSERIQQDKRDIDAYVSLIKSNSDSSQFDVALDYQKKALRYARQSRDIIILRTLGIIANSGLGKLDKAEAEYKRAFKINGAQSNVALHIAMSEAYLKFKQLDKAKIAVATALKANPADKQSVTLLTRLLEIEKAILVTGNDLAYDESIKRSQVAGLLINDLRIDQFMTSPAKSDQSMTSDQGLTDYADSAFAKEILTVHTLNLRSFRVQNGAFRPDADFTYQDLALLAEDILHLTTGINRALYIGSPSPFFDLSADDTAFNAFMNSITRGIIEGNLGGKIQPKSSVSGAKTILALVRLKELLATSKLAKN